MPGRPLGFTRRGWTLVGAAVGLLAGARLLGSDALSIVGLATLVVVAAAGAWVLVAPVRLTITRRVEPARLHVGDSARVELEVTPHRRTPVVEVREPIDHGRAQVRVLLTPLPAGEVVHAAYRLPTDRRGAVVLGPALATVCDPFGLAHRRRVAAPSEAVLVRPRVFAVAAPPHGAGRLLLGDESLTPAAPTPEAAGEFLAVRPYEIGDDPRRVHWRSSARADELMVRQHVAPQRGRTVVILDTRAGTSAASGAWRTDRDGWRDPAGAGITSPAFEQAVEATASIVTACQRSRRPVECLTTGGAVLGPVAGPARGVVLDRLATVAPDEPDLLDAVLAACHRSRELVVLVTAHLDTSLARAVDRAARRIPVVLVVTGGSARRAPTGALLVDARSGGFVDAWAVATRATPGRHGPRNAGGALRRYPGVATPGAPWTSAAASRPPSPSPR